MSIVPAGLIFALLGFGAAHAGEINIVAFGGIYDAFGADASLSDTPSSREPDDVVFKTGRIYAVRFEGFSTSTHSDFFGFGIGLSYIQREFTLRTKESTFRRTDVESDILEISMSAMFRRPSGWIRPYGGTGLSVLLVDESLKDRREETTGTVTQNSSISSNDVGGHFFSGVKVFQPESLFPNMPGRFFLVGEYRYLWANVVAEGKSGFKSLKDQITDSFFCWAWDFISEARSVGNPIPPLSFTARFRPLMSPGPRGRAAIESGACAGCQRRVTLLPFP